MLKAFDERTDPGARRRYLASGAAALAICAGLGALVLWATPPAAARAIEREVEVMLRPAPPAPAPAPSPSPPPEPPAVVPETVTPAPAAVPRRRPAVAPPKQIPREKPAERDPGAAVAPVTSGSSEAAPGPSAPAPAGPSVPPAPARPGPPAAPAGPIQLPESGTPPVAEADNRAPDYPELARSQGKEGLVILKIVISETGRVLQATVLRGDEPFARAALAAVRSWRYRPALVAGRPTAVFRIVKVPFRLRR